MCSFLFLIVYYNMNKIQFVILSITTLVVSLVISGCICIILPHETTAQNIVHIVLCFSIGLLAGVILSLITIVFEATRKDN